MNTNVMLAGLVLAGICFLAGIPLVGAVFLAVAIVLFVLRNRGMR